MNENILKLHNAARAVIEGQYRLLSYLYGKCMFHLGDLKAIQVMELENADLVKKYSDLALQLGIPPENYFKEATTSDASGVVRGANMEREVTEPEKPAEDKPVGEAELNIVVELKEAPLPASAIFPKYIDKVKEFLSQMKYSLGKIADNWSIVTKDDRKMPISITSNEPSLYYFFYDPVSLLKLNESISLQTSPLCIEFRDTVTNFSNAIDSIITIKPVVRIGEKTYPCTIAKEFPDRYQGPRDYGPITPTPPAA